MSSLANQPGQAGAGAIRGNAGTTGAGGRADDTVTTGGRPPCDPGMPLVPLDMRRLLRRATQRYHDRLDALSILAPLTLPGVTLAQYQAATVAMLRTYIQVDACLLQPPPADRTASLKTVAPYRARSVAMQRDLRAMGIEPGPAILQATMVLDAPADLPTYLGMRYVIEGSQFGNRIIGRNLQAVFGNAADDICTAWLSDAKAEDGWTSVMAALSTLETRRDVAAALRGARQTFHYFVTNLCIPTR